MEKARRSQWGKGHHQGRRIIWLMCIAGKKANIEEESPPQRPKTCRVKALPHLAQSRKIAGEVDKDRGRAELAKGTRRGIELRHTEGINWKPV